MFVFCDVCSYHTQVQSSKRDNRFGSSSQVLATLIDGDKPELRSKEFTLHSEKQRTWKERPRKEVAKLHWLEAQVV